MENLTPVPEEVINNHIGTVWEWALKYAHAFNMTNHLEDIVQEGIIGVIKAYRRYDPSKGANLNTYATKWIRSSIGYYLLKNASVVSYNTNNERRTKFWKKGVDKDSSLDEPVSEEMIETRKDILESEEESAYDRIRRLEATKLVREALNELKLSKQERAIVEMRLLADPPDTLQVVGDRIGISRQAINIKEQRLKKMLMKRLSNKIRSDLNMIGVRHV